ncbi:ribosomal peptide maturation radical SAM protein 1 [Nocardia tenerifensis]|uniref:Ribosomal peptide maturation radical SAM protein 1 n=1 Tax=Nocardia tenerifensis TaxID=228006 RepID=A0A318KHE3_9NOCA|nr:RiPP maturation radical SAM C-methyltransferase [Nocardia tenerifensis]PXX71593.1 ribosomal peptide maturation radical SAM protein 1 [Nocardia tenerifensis]
MKVLLVSMPWNLLETPSLPVATLRVVAAQRCGVAHEVGDRYLNLAWAEYLRDATDGHIGIPEYDYVANVGVWHGMGDWIFTPALYDTPEWRRDRYEAYLARRGVRLGASLEMARHSRAFIEMQAERIADEAPDLIGFSSTFQQNVPSLALAKRIKALRPETTIIMGGGNCDMPMGPAIHRNFSFIDYVMSGEAEQSFVDFLDYLHGERSASAVRGLSWRAPDRTTVTNPPAPSPAMHTIPAPDYTEWFAALAASPIRDAIRPRLVYEAARGCWWGEKHTCTFCGLNGLTMKFRSRPAEQVLTHLHELVERHRVLDIVAVDNILDMEYLRTLLPRLAELDWDLHFYYEVKANLREDDIRLLRRAGLVHIQPGIENLSSRVLSIMDKGVHATQNVKLLRDCENHDITVDWNYLYGFPGETEDDYAIVLRQLPALAHLQPPGGSVRILLERYSPHFERPELGFRERRPAALYDHVYDLDREQLEDLAYQFDAPHCGIGTDYEGTVRSAITSWQQVYLASSLVARELPDRTLLIEDRRAGWPAHDLKIEAGPAAELFRRLHTPHTIAGAARAAGLTPEAADELVGEWERLGLVFHEGGRVVSLPTRRASIKSANDR